MKVIQINCVYKQGSTGKIVYDIHNTLLKNGIASIVLYGREKKPAEPNVYKISTEIEAKIHAVFSKLFGVEFGFSPIATLRAEHIILKEKPDVVHLHCLNGHFINVYRLIRFLKKHQIDTVLSLHAEIMHTAGCDHAMDCEKWKTECCDCLRIQGLVSHFFRDDAKHCYRLMQNACAGFTKLTVVGVSQWITDRARQSPIFQDANFATVPNGIDTQVFCRRDGTALRQKLQIPQEKKIILHVTPNFLSPIKGANYLLELATRMPEYQFIVVGFNGDKSILPSNVLPIAHTENQQELAAYYSMADCFVSTSMRETYPTVCIEAAACGCNVVGFRVGGLPETIPDGMGEAVVPFDIDALEIAVRKWANCKASDALIAETNIRYGKTYMAERYMEIYPFVENS